MFAGLYSVEYSGSIALDDDEDDNNCTDYYEITLQDALRSLIGKLVIDWGAGAVAWVQYPDRQDKVITELRDRSEADQPEPSPHRKTLPPVSPTDDEQRSSDRQRLQLKFWQSLLNRPKAKTTRHCNISPSDCGWISASSGLRGVNFSYVISKDEARIDLYIDRGVGQTETNKRIFDSLHSQKKKIEKGFGEELSWQRLDEKRACRIAYTLPIGGYRSDESKWPEIQDLMIDGMILLEKALLPHIENLKTELVSENRYIPKQQNYGSKQMTPGTLEIDGEQATIDDKEVWQSSSKKLAAMLNKNYVPESTSVGTAWVIAFYTAVKDFDAKIITAPDVSGFPDPMEDDGEV
jgi:hypothetical protein